MPFFFPGMLLPPSISVCCKSFHLARPISNLTLLHSSQLNVISSSFELSYDYPCLMMLVWSLMFMYSSSLLHCMLFLNNFIITEQCEAWSLVYIWYSESICEIEYSFLYCSSRLSGILLGQAQMLPSQLELPLSTLMVTYMLFITYLQPSVLLLLAIFVNIFVPFLGEGLVLIHLCISHAI